MKKKFMKTKWEIKFTDTSCVTSSTLTILLNGKEYEVRDFGDVTCDQKNYECRKIVFNAKPANSKTLLKLGLSVDDYVEVTQLLENEFYDQLPSSCSLCR